MKNSWTQTFRRLAAVSVVAGSTAFSSAMCYAQIAFDNASDPVYNNGWQAGDNGGFGFGPWNFDGTYDSPVQQTIDSASPFNQLGTAWTLFNPLGPIPGPEPPPDEGTDIARAGRGFAPLQVGQTLRMVIDNPTQRNFFRGYIIKLNTGGENICYGNVGCTTMGPNATRLSIGTFEYFTDGKWFPAFSPDVFDTDTDAGVQIDVSLTSPDSYVAKMTPLDNPGQSFVASGALEETGAINWVQFEMFNTDSNPNAATDFYIRSVSIVIPEPATAFLMLVGAAGTLVGMARGSLRKRE
jgi:hypothetical protein